MIEKDKILVKEATVRRVMRNISNINISSDAADKMQNALNYLGVAIIESAYISAIANNRRTILEQDIDIALEALYNYSEAWDNIFEEPDDEFVQDIDDMSRLY